jgi:hypothetical protein
MAAQIVVPINRGERAEDLVPYIEFLAQPGSIVIFLVSINANRFAWWLEAVSLPARGDCGDTTVEVLSASASCARQRQQALEGIAGVRRILESKGLSVDVECYHGPVGRVLDRLCNTDTRTLVLRSRRPSLIASWAAWLRFRRVTMARPRDAMMTLSLLRT